MNKPATLVFALALGAAAFAQTSPPAECPETTLEENKALVRRYFEEGYVTADAAVIDEVLADDFNRNQTSRVADDEGGNADDVARVEARLREFPDLRVTVEDLIAEGDKVVVRLTWAGTNGGPFEDLGAPATDRRAEWTATNIFRVECGLLAENWVESDLLTRLRQVGIITDDEFTTVGEPSVTLEP